MFYEMNYLLTFYYINTFYLLFPYYIYEIIDERLKARILHKVLEKICSLLTEIVKDWYMSYVNRNPCATKVGN